MKYFLMVFDRPRGRLLVNQEFTDRASALRARFRAEREHSGSRDIEVVVLGADSVDALHRTHARYFETAGDLVRSAASRLAAG